MIPPSITLVIYGIITENSIAKLFMAGIFPGILISLLLSCFVMVRIFLNPELIRKENNVFDLLPGIDKEEKNSENARSILNDFYIVSPPLILIILVLGSLYFGVATPTEAAGIGAVGALLMVMMRGRLTLTRLEAILGATAKNSVMILFLIIGGMTLSYVVSYMGLARELSALIVNAGLDRWTIMILIYILWLVLGCLMDPLSMIVLTIPFIYPTILELGFDPLWLGIVSTLCVEIGMITPPIGLNLFVLKAITDVPMAEIMLGAFPFVLVLIVGMVILSLFPKICLILPSTM
jgi:tripartite ATP-independent transporter DctM subunit